MKWLARRQWREANSDYLYCLIGSPLARTTSNTENETSGTKTNQKPKQNARAHRLERTRRRREWGGQEFDAYYGENLPHMALPFFCGPLSWAARTPGVGPSRTAVLCAAEFSEHFPRFLSAVCSLRASESPPGPHLTHLPGFIPPPVRPGRFWGVQQRDVARRPAPHRQLDLSSGMEIDTTAPSYAPRNPP